MLLLFLVLLLTVLPCVDPLIIYAVWLMFFIVNVVVMMKVLETMMTIRVITRRLFRSKDLYAHTCVYIYIYIYMSACVILLLWHL